MNTTLIPLLDSYTRTVREVRSLLLKNLHPPQKPYILLMNTYTEGVVGVQEGFRKFIKLPIVLGLAVAVALAGGAAYVYAETYPGGEDNGKTSRLKELSQDLASLNHGSTSNTPDWGADWNRISTSAKWQPGGDVTANDVAVGKKFYNGDRTEQTGTRHLSEPCPTQGWHDSASAANTTDNCAPTWPVATPAIAGDDKKDPFTNLVWSKCLINTAGTNDFTTGGCSRYSWDNTGGNNASKTAIQLCSDRGNGWRLPTQKELMQAYIDGSNFNLASPGAYHWSATEHSTTRAWRVHLSSGATSNATKSNSTFQVRCVR